jgi:hypothetical protein
LDGGLNLGGLKQVALDCQNFGGGSVQLSFGAGELFGMTRDESDFCSARANLSRDFQTKTARAAGDEGDLIAVGK